MTRIPDGHINSSAFCKKYSVRRQNAKWCNHLNHIVTDTTPFLIGDKTIEWVYSFEYLDCMLSDDEYQMDHINSAFCKKYSVGRQNAK
jgi:hypothetical protein